MEWSAGPEEPAAGGVRAACSRTRRGRWPTPSGPGSSRSGELGGPEQAPAVRPARRALRGPVRPGRRARPARRARVHALDGHPRRRRGRRDRAGVGASERRDSTSTPGTTSAAEPDADVLARGRRPGVHDPVRRRRRARSWVELFEDTMLRRRYPGEGDFDLDRLPAPRARRRGCDRARSRSSSWRPSTPRSRSAEAARRAYDEQPS